MRCGARNARNFSSQRMANKVEKGGGLGRKWKKVRARKGPKTERVNALWTKEWDTKTTNKIKNPSSSPDSFLLLDFSTFLLNLLHFVSHKKKGLRSNNISGFRGWNFNSRTWLTNWPIKGCPKRCKPEFSINSTNSGENFQFGLLKIVKNRRFCQHPWIIKAGVPVAIRDSQVLKVFSPIFH